MAKGRKFHLAISDNAKAALLRWWLVGMCYFMIGFGTQAGMRDDPLDLIFFLGVGIGLVTVVIYNPIAYSAFDIVRDGQVVNRARKARSGAAKARDNLLEIGLSLGVVTLVYLTYQGANELLVRALEREAGTVLIPGEPFGFATLYLLFRSAVTGVLWRLAAAVRAARAQGRGEDGEGAA